MTVQTLAATYTLNDPDGNRQRHPRVATIKVPAGKTGTVAFGISAGYENTMIVLEDLGNGTYSEIMRYGTYSHHIKNTNRKLAGGKLYLFASWFKEAYGGGAEIGWQPCRGVKVDTLQQDVKYFVGAEDGVDNDFNDIYAVVTMSVMLTSEDDQPAEEARSKKKSPTRNTKSRK